MRGKVMLKMTHIKRSFISGKKPLQVLDGVNFNVNEGDLISIVGKSGSGKSTLLNIISMLDHQYEGEYSFDDQIIGKMSEKKRFNFRVANIGYVFQTSNLINEYNVLENIEMPLGYKGVSRKERIKRVKKVLNDVGLSDKLKSYPVELSGGEQQRVAIARALVSQPRLLVADEPTGNLDPNTGKQIMDMLCDVCKTGTAVCIVTHDMDLSKKTEKIFKLKRGILEEQ
jgi:putative ABC transport system ATP-binding protein